MDCRISTTTDKTLADRINFEHKLATDAARTAIEHARNAGELLIEAKVGCPHGTWANWLADNFEGSARTARVYMQVAENWTAIEAKRQHAANLTLREALRLTVQPHTPVDETISDLPDLGQLAAGISYYANGEDGSTAFVVPSAVHPGYTYISRFPADYAWCDFTKRPILIADYVLELTFQRWKFVALRPWHSSLNLTAYPELIYHDEATAAREFKAMKVNS